MKRVRSVPLSAVLLLQASIRPTVPCRVSRDSRVRVSPSLHRISRGRGLSRAASLRLTPPVKTAGRIPVREDLKAKDLKVRSLSRSAEAAIPLKGEPEPKSSKEKTAPGNPTPNEIRKKSSRKKALVSSALAVALVLAGILVLLFVVHHLFDYFAVKPNLEFVTNGSIEHTIGSRAIIVRNESVISSDHGGDFVTQAAEGSRVAAGQSIAMVVPEDMQTVVENLRSTQSQISDVQQELIANGLAEGADVIYSDIDQSLNPIINMLRIDSIEGNLSELSSYSSSISVLLNQRELELADLDFDDERLRTLRSDERGYESQLQNRASVINATEPGIISFKLDGLETVLNYEVLLNADAVTIRDYIDNAVGVITSDLTNRMRLRLRSRLVRSIRSS